MHIHQSFNIPSLVLIIPNIRHRHILHTVLRLGDGETVPQKFPHIAGVIVLEIIMFVSRVLHELQVVVETTGPHMDTSVGLVILEDSC